MSYETGALIRLKDGELGLLLLSEEGQVPGVLTANGFCLPLDDKPVFTPEEWENTDEDGDALHLTIIRTWNAAQQGSVDIPSAWCQPFYDYVVALVEEGVFQKREEPEMSCKHQDLELEIFGELRGTVYFQDGKLQADDLDDSPGILTVVCSECGDEWDYHGEYPSAIRKVIEQAEEFLKGRWVRDNEEKDGPTE